MYITNIPQNSFQKILGYGCVTGAGYGVDALWNALDQQKECAQIEHLGENMIQCARFPDEWSSEKDSSVLEILIHYMTYSFHEALKNASLKLKELKDKKYGVIFASTKGIVEDFLKLEKMKESDPLTPLFHLFLELQELSPSIATCVSNACGSSHAAFFCAQEWLQRENDLDFVIVLAAESVGPFIKNGFFSLKILNPSGTLPFDQNRNGLQLGEATSCFILSKSNFETAPQPHNVSKQLFLKKVSIVMEGSSLTRPSLNESSLKRSLNEVGFDESHPPQFILAHATGTRLNDASEAHCFWDCFKNESIPITSAKWCVGHTLGASGCVDMIAACEIIKNGKIFPMGKTKTIDPEFKGNFLIQNNFIYGPSYDCAITSLGFGGIHSSIRIGI